MEHVNSHSSGSLEPQYEVVSEQDLSFGCDWSVNYWGQLVKGSVEISFKNQATKDRVSKEIFSHLYKPSLITKEFFESKLNDGRLDLDYEGFLEIFIQHKEYWMDLSLDVRSLLLSMIDQGYLERPEHLQ